MAATKRLNFNHGVAPPVELRYETDDDARVREYLINSPQSEIYDDDQIDQLLRAYHSIARVRAHLGIK